MEVFRAGAGYESTVCEPGEPLALVTDAGLAHEHRFGLDDGEALARFLVERLGLTARRRLALRAARREALYASVSMSGLEHLEVGHGDVARRPLDRLVQLQSLGVLAGLLQRSRTRGRP